MLDEACRQLDALLSDAELDRFADLDYHLANRSGLRHVHLDKPHVLDMPCCIRPVPIKSLFQAHILREIASLRKEANYMRLTNIRRLRLRIPSVSGSASQVTAELAGFVADDPLSTAVAVTPSWLLPSAATGRVTARALRRGQRDCHRHHRHHRQPYQNLHLGTGYCHPA